MVDSKDIELPPIPDKLYFTIGEVGDICLLKPHVLRYWEQEFTQLAPTKRRGNRRYYQHKDIVMVRNIRSLLYEQGFTIEGARHQLQSAQVDKKSKSKLHNSLDKAIKELESVLGDIE